MKKVLLSLLVIVLVLGVVAAAGVTGYRFGYAQAIRTTATGQTPQIRPFDDLNPRGMRMHDFGFDREFQRGIRSGGFPRMGFGFFSPFRFLLQIVVLALIVWFLYLLLTRSGWQLVRTTQTAETRPGPAETQVREVTEVKEQRQED